MFYFRVVRKILNAEIVKNLYEAIKWAYNMECVVDYLTDTCHWVQALQLESYLLDNITEPFILLMHVLHVPKLTLSIGCEISSWYLKNFKIIKYFSKKICLASTDMIVEDSDI